jgi:hypothetical protein
MPQPSRRMLDFFLAPLDEFRKLGLSISGKTKTF